MKDEDTEERRDPMEVKDESQELNGVKKKPHKLKMREKSSSCSETEKNVSQKRTEAKSSFACSQCGKSFTRKGHLEVHMMEFVKDDSEDMSDAEACRIKDEDGEEQRDLVEGKEQSEEQNEEEEKKQDRSHHTGIDTDLLRISADGCRVDEAFTGESLVDTTSADTSGMRCGRV
ncbi:unnamed protein product [Leuciscus chuanchicus]